MDWSPFRLCAADERPPEPRSIATADGLGDRLRTAAFAERQAREAFRWAADRYPDAPEPRRSAWRRLADEEDRHYGLLMGRMAELGVDPAARPVSGRLWTSLTSCATWTEFAAFMARAEQRGLEAELSFQKALAARDPTTAAIFGRIAADEARHVALAA